MLLVTTILDRVAATLYVRLHPDERIKVNNLTPNCIFSISAPQDSRRDLILLRP